MTTEWWLGFFRIILYSGLLAVAIATIGTNILSSKVDKKKDEKIDELLSGNQKLQTSNEKLLQNIGQYQKDLNEKNEKIQELEKSQESLKKLTVPRTIAQEQKDKLISLLSFKSEFPIAVACRMQDQESLNYAEELAEIFRKANWQVKPTNRTFLDNIQNEVAIEVTDDKQIETVNKIAAIFNMVGILCGPEKIRENSLSGIQANTIYLIIGSKLKDKN
ncbi:MAG: hypothetical protein A3K83_01315 [Omnitrophica WOR_2 bacterium RBG_13_44_8b]|nr:MAG: hypothetical protein A3K83_01315 [Omnitrophica WOR_2 bacterium RBG_13_44_8b]